MAHTCTDWTVRPPVRKIPLLILKHGDERVYTSVPEQLKALEEVARREFYLGNVDIAFSSSCVNLCDGLPARITEAAWEQINPYIGCITVEVSGHSNTDTPPPQIVSQDEQPTVHKSTEDEPRSSTKRKMISDADEASESNNQPDDALPSEPMQEEKTVPSDHGNGNDSASVPESRQEEEEETDVILPRRPRKRRHVVSEDEEDEEEEQEQDRALSQAPPDTSAPKPAQPSKEIEKEGDTDYRSLQDSDYCTSRSTEQTIKQEKLNSGTRTRPHSHGADSQPPDVKSQQELRTHIEPSSNQKVMIRVAHRPSKQESKFTMKGTTKVTKVLAGACKSFGLDASRTTMFLIVSTEDSDGEEENLFPCDMNDTIIRAGAERDVESRFLLKVAGET